MAERGENQSDDPVPASAKPAPSPGGAPVGRGARPRRSKRSRRWRFITRVLLGVILGLPVVVLILTQGPVATWLVGKIVKAQLGVDFRADWVSLKPDGRIVVTKMALTAPGLSGPESQLVSAENVEVKLEWAGFAGLGSRPREVIVTQPVLRVSLGPAGELNFASLLIPKGAAGAGSIPYVRIDRGALELSEHDARAALAADRFRLLARAEVSGTVAPAAAGEDEYTVDFHQVGGMPLGMCGASVRMSGKVNVRTGEASASLSGLDLGKWTGERVPKSLRDTWTKMEMSGEVSQTNFRLTRDGALELTIVTTDVALRVPVPQGQRELTGERFATMTGVSGTIRFFQGAAHSGIEADLKGLFEEDVPCVVSFHSEGVSLDSPYSATIQADGFEMDPNLRVWWLAPPSVRQILETFSGPRAKVDALINVRRAAGTAAMPGEPDIRGSVKFRDGTAAFEPFPYRVDRLSGDVHFSETEVTIDGVTGQGSGGATLLATGRFAPPTDEASVDVKVDLFDLPYDDRLQEAVERSKGRDLLHALLSRERLSELVDRKLVVSEAERAESLRRWRSTWPVAAAPGAGVTAGPALAAALGAAASRPSFSLGGMVSTVNIHVTRAFGPVEPYSYAIDVKFDEVGLLPEVFAYPMMGRKAQLTVRDDRASFECEELEGLEGGMASVRARVQSETGPGGVPAYAALIEVEATDIPITPLLINAVPDDATRVMSRDPLAPPPGPPGLDEGPSISPQRLLRDLGIAGRVNCKAAVRPRGLNEVKFDVDVDFADLTASPGGQPAGDAVRAEGVTGAIHVTQGGLSIKDLAGRLTHDRDAARVVDEAGKFSINGLTTFSESGPASLSAELKTERLDLGAPVERFIRALAKEPGDLIASVRERVKPTGRITADVKVETPPVGPADGPEAASRLGLTLTLRGAEGLELDALGTRMGIVHQRGTLTAHLVRGAAEPEGLIDLAFNDLQAELWSDAQRAGTVQAQGKLRVSADQQAGRVTLLVDEPVKGLVAGGVLESGLVRRLIAMTAGERAEGVIRDVDLRGLVEADFELRPSADPKAHGQDWSLRGVVWPQYLALSTPEVSVLIPEVRGRLTFDGDGGSVDGLQLLGGGWTVTADGSWSRRAVAGTEGGSEVDARLALWFDADDVTPSLLAVCPPSIREAAGSIDLRSPGGLHMQDAKLDVVAGEAGLRTAEFEGVLELNEASADAGIRFAELTGTLAVRVHKAESEPDPAIELALDAASVRAAGLDVRRAFATASKKGAGGEIEVGSFGGECYGGRLMGSASLGPAGAEGQGRRYEARVQVGGVRVADMLVALRRAGDGAEMAARDRAVPALGIMRPEGDSPAGLGDERRGWLDAELSVTGLTGSVTTRSGRGSLRITGGEVLDMPLAVRLIQLGNLQLPLGERMDYLQAAFWVEGERVRFDQFGLLSDSLAILGTGELSMPGLGLDLTVQSQSRMRLPVFSDMFELVRNEIITAKVTGTLDDPAIGAEPLRGTRALLGGILGAAPTADPSAQRASIERERERSPWKARSAEPSR